VVNWLYMFQNFHLIHHLFPRIPFYLSGCVPLAEARARQGAGSHLRV
jgi:fatty acid desaturase